MQNITNLLKKITGMKQVKLTSRGNTAIFAALYCCRKLSKHKRVLIPDQGGWFTYKKYPQYLELEPVEMKTDLGLIDIAELKKNLKDTCCLLYANPAGYYAEQDVKKIYEACKGKCLVILDVSGSIGRKDYSKYCDFMLASFGDDKIVNAGYGGFVATNNKEFFEKPKEIFNLTRFDDKYSAKVAEKLKNLKQRYAFLDKINKKIKKDLKNYSIIHKDKKGINVIVKYSSEKEKNELIKYCLKNVFPFRKCPFYIKVKTKAISIEVKRLR